MPSLGLDFFGALLSGGDIGESLIGDISGGDPSRIFGKKPEVAPFVPVDLTEETAKAVAGNLENLPDIKELLDRLIPNFSEMLAEGTKNALALERGEVPTDVQESLLRSDAYKAQQGGFAGTPMKRALSLRDFGLTSLQGLTLGGNMAQLWSDIAEKAYGPFTVSTGQQAGTTAANNAGIQANEQFKFNVEAAPTPSVLGHFLLDQHIGDQFMSFGLGAAGGAIAGGGAGVGFGGATAAPAVPGYTYDPRTGQYTNTGGSADWRTSATWGGGG